MRILEGKIAAVTGGNSGIGKAIARLFISHGATVVITGRRESILGEAVAEIGAGAIGFQSDVADVDSHERLANYIKDNFGRLDIFIANAGIINIAPSADVTVSAYDQLFAVNTRGVFFGVQALAPVMSDGGSIVLISSLAASKVLENHTVYAGSKAAIAAFARNWAIELKHRRIRVNVLSPGPANTSVLSKLGLPDEERPAFLEMMKAMIPAGRLGEADELAQAALFLASDAASFVNGNDLHVDGGMSLV